MFDLKVINSVLEQLEDERGIPRERVLEAIDASLATAYKKEFGRRGQFIRAHFDLSTGKTEFSQVKIIVDPSQILTDEEIAAGVGEKSESGSFSGLSNNYSNPAATFSTISTDGTTSGTPATPEKIRFNDEQHIYLEDAQKIKRGAKVGDELVFPLEYKDDFSRIAAQTAKQVIIQKIREAEKTSVLNEFGKKENEIVSGSVQRVERGNVFIDMGRAVGMLPYEEQIPNEHYNQGERLRMLLVRVEETPKGIFLRLSRSHSKFLAELFKAEVPEIASGSVEIKSIAREAGARSKIAVVSKDPHIDPVGSMVGQRGVRVNTVMSELGGEKIDIIEWSEDPAKFIEEALSPAKIIGITLNEAEKSARVEVAPDQQSLAIGKGGQNVRLAAKLTGWRIDIQSVAISEAPEEGSVTESETPSETAATTTAAPETPAPTEPAI